MQPLGDGRHEHSGKGGLVIRVLLADDMKLFRAALKNLLEKYGDFEVVAEVYCGDLIVPTALGR